MKRLARAMASLGAGLLLGLAAPVLAAQQLRFEPPATPTDAGTAAVMRDLATRVLPVYEEKDTDRFLDRVSAIQVVAGNHAPARASRQTLRARRPAGADGAGVARLLDIYVQALVLQRDGRRPFAQVFADAFREAVTPLDDLAAFGVTGWRPPPLQRLERELQSQFDRHRGRGNIELADAVDLLRNYFLFDAVRRIAGPLRALAAEDDRRRYVFEAARVPGPGGAQLQARVVRPKGARQTVPALLEFTIHRDPAEPVTGPAAHGYAGVIAFTRGAAEPQSRALPFQADGADAAAVIGWIAKQPWNDGNVAMQGEGYSGFAAWAAAGLAPPALKAIATADPMAPGIDFPMAGGIFHNYAYRWAQRVAGSRGDEAEHDDDASWRALDEAWFASGRRYRDLDRMNGRPNRYFQRWLNHPSQDRFWQKMIPFREGFAKVRIPVLTVTGYYSANQAGALYYFDQHLRYLPEANHSLLVGPWAQGSGEHFGARLRGLPVDAAARLDLTELRYQWLDHIIRGGPRPGPLQGRVNFLTGGTNEWRHAGSLEAMAGERLRLHLDARQAPGGHLLAQREPAQATFLRTQLSMKDRDDPLVATPELVTRAPQARNAVTWVSAPLAAPLELAGEVSGRIDLMTNKFDVDLWVALYELTAGGDYVKLFDPSAAFRASYTGDRVQRRLLRPGRRQQVAFRSERLASRSIAAGSRLVLVLGVNKRPDQQINYGAGNDVSEESIADARHPMRFRWYGSSYVELPVRRP